MTNPYLLPPSTRNPYLDFSPESFGGQVPQNVKPYSVFDKPPGLLESTIGEVRNFLPNLTGMEPAADLMGRAAEQQRSLVSQGQIGKALTTNLLEDPMLAAFGPEVIGMAKGAKRPPSSQLPPPTQPASPKPQGPLIQFGLESGVTQAVTKAADEMFTIGGFTRDPSRKLSDQMYDLILTDRLKPEQVAPILQKHGVNWEEFGKIWRIEEVRKSAQTLGRLGALEAKLNRLSGGKLTGEEESLIRAAGGAETRAKPWWRRATDLWRGALVVQLATAVRNFETQTANVGLHSMGRAIDHSIQRMMGKPDTPHPIDGFEPLMRMFYNPRQTKAQVDQVLNAFPKEHDALLMRFHSDVDRVTGKPTGPFGYAEKAVDVLNTANRFQEFLIRRAVFAAELSQRLERKGMSLEDAVSNNKVGAIPEEDVAGAVESALEITWGKSYSPFGKGWEATAGKFIQTVNSIPGAALAIPFPRFFMNALKWQFDYSPMGYMKLLSKEQRTKIASGDVSTITKATLGSTMLLAGYEFRKSEYAGERWYEAKLEDGTTIDLRPFNPFAAYLFVGDLIHRANTDTLRNLRAKDIAMGVLGSQMRAGTGLYILDSVLGEIVGTTDKEKAVRLIKRLGGEYAGGFFNAFQQVRDFASIIDDQDLPIRDREAAPFTAPIVSKFPGGGSESLPEVESPTRREVPTRVKPWVKQLTGARLIEPKNKVESELDRLGFKRHEYAPSMGDPDINRLVNGYMGPIVEDRVLPRIDTQEYDALTDREKEFFLDELLSEARSVALQLFKVNHPDLYARYRARRMPLSQRRLLEERLGDTPANLLDQPNPYFQQNPYMQ